MTHLETAPETVRPTGTYTAVEVSEPGTLQVVERPLPRLASPWMVATPK